VNRSPLYQLQNNAIHKASAELQVAEGGSYQQFKTELRFSSLQVPVHELFTENVEMMNKV
jgi:hypothetical protein